MSIDPVISSVWDVLKYVVVPIKRQFGYVMSSKSYAQDLQKEVGKLAYEAERVYNAVQEARNNLWNVYGHVTEWQANAEKALKEARDLLDDFEKVTKTCCYGTLPDPNCRYQFSRRAKQKIEGIQRLAQECNQFKEISFDRHAPGNVAASLASTSIKLEDDGIFKSRELIMQEIMAALADNNNSVVGIYGMGGVGKSTLLADAEMSIRKEKSFNWVAKADVSENQDVERIQGEIADALGLTNIKQKETISGRAEFLRGWLKKEETDNKKVLIILDNLWEGLDLKSVGIPCRHGNKVIGCKLLLTSRYQDVLRREMGCDRDFHLDALEEEEAKRLFVRTVGEKVHDDPFKSLVDEALHKCAGLPFLIIAMANIFKYADFYEWKDVLRQIDLSTNEGISESINKMLQLSYDRFKGDYGEELKSLLRLCVVYGVSKPSLENLVRYSVGMRLFREISSMEEVRNRLRSLIRTLKASSLLLVDDEDVDGFKIHDLVRGFVASVASRDGPLLVVKDNDKSVIELPKDKLKSCTAACFPFVDIKELPEELDCPEMRIFLLFTNNESRKVPNSFFSSMRKLMVLHLSHVCLTRSPLPFQFLENLHTLCLDGCLLEDVAMIGELKGLHILSFVNSKIQRLPKEIGKLVELRLLDLNHCSRLKIIEPGVLGNLMKLEELYMENSFDRWNAMEQTPPTNAKLIELNSMKNLCTLHVSILDPSVLPEDLNVKKLTEFKIHIGDMPYRQRLQIWDRCKGSGILELMLDPTSDILSKGCIENLLGKTDGLFLDGLNGIEQSICSLSQEGFPKLKHLHVKNSPFVHYVLQSSSYTDFKTLELLILHDLMNLEKICNNHISSKSFSALKEVEVISCHKMKVLFPLSLLRELPRLEVIRAINCHLMREIVEVDDCGKVELHNLRELKLRDLPNVKNFFTGGTVPSTNTSNDQVGTQVAFFNGQQVAFPNLETLDIYNMDNIEILWDNQVVAETFHKLKSLRVWDCNRLVNIVPSCILGRLTSLESLDVKYCNLLEVVFKHQPVNPLDGHPDAPFPMKELELCGLPKLKRVWDMELHSQVKFQCLRSVIISKCKSLVSVFSASMGAHLTQLEKLSIRGCGIVELIEKEEGPAPMFAFPKLTSLELEDLTELKCIYTGKHTSHWPALKTLEVRGSDKVEILASQPKNEMPLDKQPLFLIEKVLIPSLESLTLAGLPGLEDIWTDVSPLGLSNLQILEVFSCKSLSKVIYSSSLVKLPKLHTLRVKDCVSVQEIFNLDGLGADAYIETLLELNTIYISGLQNLRHIWNKNPCGMVRFHNLKQLTVYSCSNLRFLFFPSTVQSLAQLRQLEVGHCEKMEAIIMEEEGLRIETSETLVFPMLNNLHLVQLKSLTCFSRQKCTPEVRDEDCSTTVLFNQEVAFSSLETLCINDMDNIEIIWDNQVAMESFPKLKSLEVWSYHKLANLVPSCILGRLKSLESLSVGSCGSLEVVFKHQPLNPLDGHLVAHLPLKNLRLYGLPELKYVWDKELHNPVQFQCLRSVNISGCKSLTSLFPALVAVHLTQLEELVIRECGIVELIEKEGLVPRDVFPRLTSLKLEHLTELKCIYLGTHALCWPALKTLEVCNCNKVEILASQPENEMPLHKQPLFLIEKGAFPNLQELKLDLSGRMEIWHGHFHDGEFFCKLRVLELHHFSKEFAISTRRFVQSLANLEKLVVCESYREELTIGIEAIAGPSHELEVILPFSFQHLKTLELSNCDGLSPYVILPFSRFFQHLKTLDMSFCDGLSNIFTSTIARNLVELTKLRISKCKMLTEVICDEEGEEGLEVAFNQLKYVELHELTRLRCFGSIKYTLMFPLLEDVLVSGCPIMKCFSGGPIEAPKLERVQVSAEAWFWKDNLNITIQNMFEEMGTVAGAKFMRLSEFPELIGKWHEGLNPIKSSWQLESLMVDKCPSFKKAIPSELMPVLDHMRMLQVCDCELLEEVFDFEGLGVVKSIRALRRLEFLDLVNLPKLRRLWNNDFQGMLRFNNIYGLTLYNCSNLRHAFTPSMARCLPSLSWMKIKKCGKMEGVIAEEEGQGSAVKNITFPNLYLVELECLPNLTSFLLGKNHTLNCPQMNDLIIARCPKMRSLTRQSLVEIDHCIPSLFTPQVQFPQLRWMALSHMDNLSKIWTDSSQDTLTFEHLRKVEVENCKSLENLFPHWVATSLTQLEDLQVESCGLEEIVASGDDPSHSHTAQILFPQLTSLVFHDMPRLKSCPNLPTLNWPFLKELRVTHCDKLNMLSFVASMNKWAQRDNQHDLPDHEAHFSFERGVPALERLLLVDKDIQTIQNGKFSDDFFGKPKALTLACFHDEGAIFPPIFFLQRFWNLQSLEVFCSSFEDIFPDEGLVDEGKHPLLENLKELKLSKLCNLKHVWREGHLVAKILQSISKFEVWDCPNLTTIFPVVTSFWNLTDLVVKNSSGLMHLVTVSVITNLVHLTSMTIIGCEGMKEVVANDENGEGKVISLEKLQRLTLQNLLSLECFSSTASCIFKFPSMYSIEVEECPKMKIFCKGTISTPELCNVKLFKYELDDYWEGDLNATIQKLTA